MLGLYVTVLLRRVGVMTDDDDDELAHHYSAAAAAAAGRYAVTQCTVQCDAQLARSRQLSRLYETLCDE